MSSEIVNLVDADGNVKQTEVITDADTMRYIFSSDPRAKQGDKKTVMIKGTDGKTVGAEFKIIKNTDNFAQMRRAALTHQQQVEMISKVAKAANHSINIVDENGTVSSKQVIQGSNGERFIKVNRSQAARDG